MQTVTKEANCYKYMTQPYWTEWGRRVLTKATMEVNGVSKTKDKRLYINTLFSKVKKNKGTLRKCHSQENA